VRLHLGALEQTSETAGSTLRSSLVSQVEVLDDVRLGLFISTRGLEGRLLMLGHDGARLESC
jgi:hypothetical protein